MMVELMESTRGVDDFGGTTMVGHAHVANENGNPSIDSGDLSAMLSNEI